VSTIALSRRAILAGGSIRARACVAGRSCNRGAARAAPASKDVYVSLSKTVSEWLGLAVTAFGLGAF
jgi:hypothetical protein